MIYDTDVLILKGTRRILVSQIDPKLTHDPFPFAVVMTSRTTWRDPRLKRESVELHRDLLRLVIRPAPVERHQDGTVRALKWCPGFAGHECGWRSVDMFGPDKRNRDGRRTYCRACEAERKRFQRQQAA